ncbi:hypothetical protein GFS31_24250 [Leptolyngbya sp. BL0902]|uniref:hypothetical protein n=1 Tax=Leptolyngbya sp. BL0902 TaxID=1115757 RepID=UPI0018E719F1|nr:hypothetical protein [Leptolyngbya sp. BL0902]QQE65737.1 hypothetical protein GFS31_24250 [Leptolyngbya sp. BL0902]
MVPNDNSPQPGADVLRPDIINPLRDYHLEPRLNWLKDNYSRLSESEQVIATAIIQLYQQIQRLDGAWRIQQDRLIQLEEDQEFSRRLEQLEERLSKLEEI